MAFRALPAPAVDRLRAEQLEVAVAAGEHVEVRGQLRERTRDRQLRIRPQQRAVVEVAGHVRMQPVAQQCLEREALAPLVVHLLAVVLQRGGRGGTLVGERDRVVAVQNRGHGEDRRVHRGHRDVPVPRAQPVQLEQARRQLALDVQRGQAGAFGAGRDQGGIADPYRGRLAADRLDRLHRDQRILAAADRHQGALGQIQRADRGRAATARTFRSGSRAKARACCRSFRAKARKGDAPAQVQPVAIGEFGQAVQVQLVQQLGGGIVERAIGQLDPRRYAGLVVADASDQVQQFQGGVERRRTRGR